MVKSIWTRPIGGGARDACHALIKAFADSSITLTPDEDAARPDIGVLIIDPAETDALATLRAQAQVGARQCIGVLIRSGSVGPGAWDWLRAGLADLLQWEEPVARLKDALAARINRWCELKDILDGPKVRCNLIGRSAAWLRAVRRVTEAARFGSAPILLIGESGTGKELCARFAHSQIAGRSEGALITVDCTTISPDLSGSELFGHERGAFTGAAAARTGAFALADGGTLFLDEIGELPLPLQAQFLRSLQERRYRRVGGNTWHRTDFRLVSATNRNLEQDVADGRFRSDLYHRVAGITVRLPPLKDRREDIPALARHILAETLGEGEIPKIDAAVLDLLCRRDYAGNVRELQQLVRQMAARYAGSGPITVGQVPVAMRPDGSERPQEISPFEGVAAAALGAKMSLKDIGREATDAAIRLAVRRTGGNLAQAARLLSVTPRALQLREASRRDD